MWSSALSVLNNLPHLGIIITATTASGGIYQYTRSLLSALYVSPDFSCTVFILPECTLDLTFLNRPDWSLEIIPPAVLTETAPTEPKAAAKQFGCNKQANLYFNGFALDLLIFPAPWSLSFESGLPYLMAVHDLQHRLHPEFPEVSADGEWERREYLFGNGVKFAAGILVDSEVGKDDLLRCYVDTADAARIHILPFMPSAAVGVSVDAVAVDIAALRTKYGIKGDYFFYPAQFWAHKNHARLIQALAILREQYGKVRQLVLVGSYHGPAHEQRQQVFDAMWGLAYQLRVADQIRYLGYVPDEEMQALFSNALALVMPTFFGPTNIPVLEAWAADCPVITSDIRGVREQGGDAVLLANPNDAGAIAKAMCIIDDNDDVRRQLIVNGRLRLQQFDRSSFCRKLTASINACLKTRKASGAYLVTAIVSTYNSEQFIRACLEDLVSQTLFDQGLLEIVVIDSASPQQEGDIVHAFVEAFGDRIKYIRTDTRETIYQAWNRGIKAAQGKYVTNANTDDRHRADALEQMALTLDANPDVALVYGDSLVTGVPNQTFEHHIRCGYHLRPEYQPEIMLSGCHMGPQPMWRRSVHDTVGYFGEQYRSAGDYEFWCRVARKYRLLHIPQFLGLYYENPQGFANSDTRLSVQETISIQHAYAGSFPAPARDYSMNYQYNGVVAPNRYVNVCLVTRNNPAVLEAVIESLIRNTDYPHVITVADMSNGEGGRDFLLGLKKRGLITNLLLLDGYAAVEEAFAQAERCEPAAGFQLAFGNSIVVGMPSWLSAFVMEAQNCAAPFLTNRIWSRDRVIRNVVGILPAYVQDYSPETSCCMKLPARPAGV